MLVNSLKFVDLRNATYRGIWLHWIVSIPFIDETLEIPVSKEAPELKYVNLSVKNNSFSFESEE